MARRVVALWGVLGCFGVGAALAAAEFRFEECREDLLLAGRLLALLRVVGRLGAGAALIFSIRLYFR